MPEKMLPLAKIKVAFMKQSSLSVGVEQWNTYQVILSKKHGFGKMENYDLGKNFGGGYLGDKTGGKGKAKQGCAEAIFQAFRQGAGRYVHGTDTDGYFIHSDYRGDSADGQASGRGAGAVGAGAFADYRGLSVGTDAGFWDTASDGCRTDSDVVIADDDFIGAYDEECAVSGGVMRAAEHYHPEWADGPAGDGAEPFNGRRAVGGVTEQGVHGPVDGEVRDFGDERSVIGAAVCEPEAADGASAEGSGRRGGLTAGGGE